MLPATAALVLAALVAAAVAALATNLVADHLASGGDVRYLLVRHLKLTIYNRLCLVKTKLFWCHWRY